MAILPGKRVRDNSIFGTLTSALTSVGGTMSSAELSDLSAISGDHAILTLDPFRQFGDPEIVMVTVHTAASTSATITRGLYGTTARAHDAGVQWVHAATSEDFIEVLTSATRPADQYEGQFIFETDTNKLVGFGGVDWAPRDAGGTIGYSQTIVNQTGITTETDLTSLSVPVTVGTGRRIKITGFVPQFTRTAGTILYVIMRIKEGSTYLSHVSLNPVTSLSSGGLVQTVLTPTAGVHTYKLTAESDATFQTNLFGSPAFILVEDIGAA